MYDDLAEATAETTGIPDAQIANGTGRISDEMYI